MEPAPLAESLARLDALISKHGLDRDELLDPDDLAQRTALPAETVRSLLVGGRPPDETVNDRVRSRVRTLAAARLASTKRRMADLAAELHDELGVSEMWARSVCDGKKVPNIELLHALVRFFGVEGEAFFTLPADDALSRELQKVLGEIENDPVVALMDQYGVRSTDLRMHGSVPRRQLERLLEGVFRSVAPEPEDGGESR
ncbi:hypothetical protein [Streptomyces sp. NBC_01601]|uniref:hypothetical protein n=1 Tax=Streptomyces sp. NBC_01601 TaxID=2975892 RepID=UPI002E297240|nr:hypothetical protein [Streptomyces sp. NBC_01601]